MIFQNILHTHQKMQNSTVFISFVMVAACCCLLADAAPQDLGSPIRIAQCRALCLDKVNKHLYQLTSPPDKLVKLGKQTESLVYILHTHTHVFIISHLSSCHCFCMLTTALFEFVYFSHRKPVKHWDVRLFPAAFWPSAIPASDLTIWRPLAITCACVHTAESGVTHDNFFF